MSPTLEGGLKEHRRKVQVCTCIGNLLHSNISQRRNQYLSCTCIRMNRHPSIGWQGKLILRTCSSTRSWTSRNHRRNHEAGSGIHSSIRSHPGTRIHQLGKVRERTHICRCGCSNMNLLGDLNLRSGHRGIRSNRGPSTFEVGMLELLQVPCKHTCSACHPRTLLLRMLVPRKRSRSGARPI